MSIKKKLLMAMGTMALGAFLIAAGTMALFTAEVSNEGNTFATGTLTIEDITGGNGSAVFTVSNIAPGDDGDGVITIANTGSLDAWVRIQDVDTDGYLFDGDYPIELSYNEDAIRINAGQSYNFNVSWEFPLAAGNDYQGAAGEATFNFQAVQVRNNDDVNNIEWGRQD